MEELTRLRYQLVPQFLEDRETQVYSMGNDESISAFLEKVDKAVPVDTDSDCVSFSQYSYYLDTFHKATNVDSKLKKEFERMITSTLYLKTRVVIKFPDNLVLMAKFSPKENLKAVVDFVSSVICLKEPFYLFQCPPIQKVTSKMWHQTLEEAGCVPRVIYRFALEDPKNGVGLKGYLKESISFKFQGLPTKIEANRVVNYGNVHMLPVQNNQSQQPKGFFEKMKDHFKPKKTEPDALNEVPMVMLKQNLLEKKEQP